MSTDTAPELLQTPPERLTSLMLELLRARNFFTGMNPVAITRWLQTDPTICERVTGVELLAPWTWRLGPKRAYLVFAVRFARTHSP